jgi:cation diffusion facilitator CzcD-associated flavoprotein CzcO
MEGRAASRRVRPLDSTLRAAVHHRADALPHLRREGVGVISAEFAGDGYQVVTTTGRLAARCVVIASGGQRRPVIPRMASRLAADPAEYPQPEAGRSPETMSLRAERIAVVVWYTGFGPDTGWLCGPVLGPGGNPAHRRGITAFPGLYAAGFPWLSNRRSGILYGVAADAARIAQHIASRTRRHGAEPPVLPMTEFQITGALP